MKTIFTKIALSSLIPSKESVINYTSLESLKIFIFWVTKFVKIHKVLCKKVSTLEEKNYLISYSIAKIFPPNRSLQKFWYFFGPELGKIVSNFKRDIFGGKKLFNKEFTNSPQMTIFF